MIGIYGIRNKINGKIYIGQSIDVNKRFIRHRYQLNKGIHKNIHLQQSWNKHGSSNFEFLILLECEKNDLDINEEKQASLVLSSMLYNITDDFTSRVGERNPFFGKKHSVATKLKLSELKKKTTIGENNPNYGNKLPLAVRLKMVNNNPRTKLTPDNVRDIVNMLKNGMSHENISKMFNISRTVITRISNGTRWTNITGGPVKGGSKCLG